MKVLLVNDGCLELAGVSLFMYQWAKAVLEEYPDSLVTAYFRLSVKNRALKNAFEELGVTVIAGNHPENGTTADKANRDAVKGDIHNILRDRYDVVHIHSSVIGFTTLVLGETKNAKVPIRISHAHGSFGESRLKRMAHDVMRNYIRRTATIYAGCSEQAGTYLFGEKGIHSDKWIKVPNAIETQKFRFSAEARNRRRAEIGIGDDELLLGAVGYLEEVKNHIFLIDVVRRLKENGHPAKLVILGAGSLKEKLASGIHSLGLDKDIILYGQSDDVPGWLSAMDCYLMPSLSEGLPLSAVEAQASGLKCILSDRISAEVDILPDVCHLPIDGGSDPWVTEIAGIKTNGDDLRCRAVDKVACAGFDRTVLRSVITGMYQK